MPARYATECGDEKAGGDEPAPPMVQSVEALPPARASALTRFWVPPSPSAMKSVPSSATATSAGADSGAPPAASTAPLATRPSDDARKSTTVLLAMSTTKSESGAKGL